jgi:hypothetical protein
MQDKATIPPNNGKSHSVLTYSLPSGNVFPRVRAAVKWLAPESLWPRLWRLFVFLDALRFAGRTFLGHMRILISENSWTVELGHPLIFLQNGSVLRSNRTAACSYGIRELKARYPWASLVENRIFLQGFDAGEAFSYGRHDIPESEFVECGSSEFPSWNPALNTEPPAPIVHERKKGDF